MSGRRDRDDEAKRQCPSWETLVDLTYDELEPDRAAQVRAHIAACDACTETFKELLAFMKLADRLPGGPVPPSPEVGDRLRAEVLKQRPFYHRWLQWIRNLLVTPLPAYQVLLAGAIFAILFQLIVPGTPEKLKEMAEQMMEPPASSLSGVHQAGIMGPAVISNVTGPRIQHRGPAETPVATPTPHAGDAQRVSEASGSVSGQGGGSE